MNTTANKLYIKKQAYRPRQIKPWLCPLQKINEIPILDKWQYMI